MDGQPVENSVVQSNRGSFGPLKTSALEKTYRANKEYSPRFRCGPASFEAAKSTICRWLCLQNDGSVLWCAL
jgi:hypothetical protein